MRSITATLLALALSTAVSATARAAPPIAGGISLTTGIGASFDGDPATFRIQVQGELPLYADDDLGIGLVLPLEWTTSGDDRFGASGSNTMITFVPSARLRAFNTSVVRIYGDAGVGLAYITADSDSWFLSSANSRTGLATRLVAGLELGSPNGGITFVVEPLGLDTLFFNGDTVAGYVGRIGLGWRF